MEINEADGFIERIAEAVAMKLEEREKINMIAQEVLERLREASEAATPRKAEQHEEHSETTSRDLLETNVKQAVAANRKTTRKGERANVQE